MEPEAVVEKLINCVEDVSMSNLNQTICSFYDLKSQFSEEILLKLSSHFDLPNPPVTNTSGLSTQKYLAVTLPFILYLFGQEQYDLLCELTSSVIKSIVIADVTRHYDRLLAKVYFFFALSKKDCIPELLTAYRKSCDLHLHHTQATVVNCLLKKYMDEGSYKLALSFLAHCNFPTDVPTAQLARYHFYVGHLKAITLDYAEAQHHLQLSLRRAPQNRHAEYFRSLVGRNLMVVMMLQGQVPARSMLIDTPVYLDLARSILKGDIRAFQEIASHQQFIDDGLAVLVQRLRSAVILAGLTMLSHCYSRISFEDIAVFLHIGSAEDAEGFCARAAADGIIEAVIDHDNGCLISIRTKDDVAASFTDRINKNIQDCFGIREDTQRTMHEEAVAE